MMMTGCARSSVVASWQLLGTAPGTVQKRPAPTYGHTWPDRDESTRAAVEAVLTARTEQGRNRALGP